jgi:hypothetical protein
MYSCRQTYSALLLSDPLRKTNLIQLETQHVWSHSLTSCSVGLKMHHRSLYKYINDINHFLLSLLLLLRSSVQMHVYTLMDLQYQMTVNRKTAIPTAIPVSVSRRAVLPCVVAQAFMTTKSACNRPHPNDDLRIEND